MMHSPMWVEPEFPAWLFTEAATMRLSMASFTEILVGGAENKSIADQHSRAHATMVFITQQFICIMLLTQMSYSSIRPCKLSGGLECLNCVNHPAQSLRGFIKARI